MGSIKTKWIVAVLALLACVSLLLGQSMISGGGANIIQIASQAVATAATGIMKVGLTDGTGNAITSTSSALDVNIKSGAIAAGGNIIGYVRLIPAGCSAQSTPAQFSTVGVATGAGTTVTSTTSCVVSCYANNITNSNVTLRLADKAGTPVIWVGGNNDFTILPNSNMRVPLAEGVVFTSGITAIAGTASAVNLACSTYQ